MAVIELFALTSSAVVNVYMCVFTQTCAHNHPSPRTSNLEQLRVPECLTQAFTVCLPYCSPDVAVLRGQRGIPGLGIEAHLSPSPGCPHSPPVAGSWV